MTILACMIDAVLYLAIAGVLIQAYRRTKKVGTLWLLPPMALIPAMALPITLWRHTMADRLIAGKTVDVFPFTRVAQGRLTIGSLLTLLNFMDHIGWGVFALAAVLVLVRQKNTRATSPHTAENRRELKR
jgi:hypothetical protein